MSVKVLYFASLKEFLGRSEDELAFVDTATVIDVWNQSTNSQQIPDNTLVAINMEYASVDSPVEDGDEVAFFPPVTGG